MLSGKKVVNEWNEDITPPGNLEPNATAALQATKSIRDRLRRTHDLWSQESGFCTFELANIKDTRRLNFTVCFTVRPAHSSDLPLLEPAMSGRERFT